MKPTYALLQAATTGKHHCPHPCSCLPLPHSKGDNKSSPVSFQPGTFSPLCHFSSCLSSLSWQICPFQQPRSPPCRTRLAPAWPPSLAGDGWMGWAGQKTEPLLLGMVRGQLWQGNVAGTPVCPSTAQRGQAGSAAGLQEATKASLEGALWVSRGSSLISWAQRFPSALTPSSPSCPRHLAGSPSESLPIPCIPLPMVGPCTSSWPSTQIQHGFSLWHVARCQLSSGNPPFCPAPPRTT